MSEFPQLFTQKLILRKIQIEDVPALVKYANNKKISENVLNLPYPYQEPDAVFRISYVVQGFKKKARYVFAIILKERQELIGEISLHMDNIYHVAQLGYWVGEPFWNQGIASEAVAAMLQFGFETLNLDFIYATCNEQNKASAKVLEKNGMEIHHVNGGVIQYRIVRSLNSTS